MLATVLATGVGCFEGHLVEGVDGGAGAGGKSGGGGAVGSAGRGMAGSGGVSPAGRGGGGGPAGGAGGGSAGSSGGGGAGSFGGNAGSPLDPGDSLSDFELETVARINPTGTPPRNGHWFSYNDLSPTCLQVPPVGAVHRPSLPPVPSPGPSGGLALRATWDRCTVWGAGVGAYFNLVEPPDGGVGTPLPYDLAGYQGITFWAALATAGTDTRLRFKIITRGETPIRDGGTCDETVVGVNKCGDAWGQTFVLPTAGNWRQITVQFANITVFKQEGWGYAIPWNPSDVLGIQIQSQNTEMDQPFDFWVDDVYLFR